MKKTKANSRVDKDAVKKYVAAKVKTMRKYGTSVSTKKYKRLLNKVTQAVAS